MATLEHERLGFNYRLSELACALGIGQIERIEELLLRRSYVAAAYEERLTVLAADHGGGGEDGLLVPAADHGDERRSWFVYVVQLPLSVDREAVISSLAEQGIPSKAYLPCLHLFPHLRELGYREGQFPIAERAGARSLGLPFFTSMREDQVGPRLRGARRRAGSVHGPLFDHLVDAVGAVARSCPPRPSSEPCAECPPSRG